MFFLLARTFSHEKRVEYLSLQPQTVSQPHLVVIKKTFEKSNSYQNHPDLARGRTVYLSDNSSSAEAGVLVSITVQGPSPPVGSTRYHRQRTSPSHYYTHQERETPLIYPVASYPWFPQ
ncbi:hypothetical protein AVEN_275449-1 [Araneus ventricosus]|uniref:Uncharacterized protein n=1 Tax=Araneus ventricosus TaxID=182803 RepID=A0A4Y2ISZ0_ARAVE|nr:hypothetical protein AVEN_275449-1 [Araneus ventricosus]